jgi:hypothetical protein
VREGNGSGGLTDPAFLVSDTNCLCRHGLLFQQDRIQYVYFCHGSEQQKETDHSNQDASDEDRNADSHSCNHVKMPPRTGLSGREQIE